MNDIDKINARLNELESQLCGAKKKRIDQLEERIKHIEAMMAKNTMSKLIDNELLKKWKSY